jgi:hypothetical protein
MQAAETPRRGDILLAAIGAEPPSLDPHQEGTFANNQLMAPCYSQQCERVLLPSS